MSASRPLIAVVVALTLGVSSAVAFESVYRISFAPRPPDSDPTRPEPAVDEEAKRQQGPALAVRLVDSGGIGIPVDEGWGADYSHDRRTFREVIRQDPPYVDAGAFERVEADWRSYVER